MTKVSKRILNKNLEKRIFELFTTTITDLKNAKEVEEFLDDLLSPVERIMLAKRLAIAILLSKGYTYNSIDNTLKVSQTTIMRISYWLKYGNNNGYKKVVEKYMQRQKGDEFSDKVEEIFLELSGPKAVGSSSFERKKRLGKKIYKRKIERSII